MLKDKMLWMKDSGNIRDEIRQCREEGRMISGLLPRAEEILSMEEGPEKESCARQLLLELENCPVDEAFPFEEPVEWEKLAAACEGNGIHLQIPEEELQDRIRSAWTGRASGCLLGVPVEGWSRGKIRGYLEESGQLGELPAHLQNYIDYEAYGRDMELDGTFIVTNHGVYEILR